MGPTEKSGSTGGWVLVLAFAAGAAGYWLLPSRAGCAECFTGPCVSSYQCSESLNCMCIVKHGETTGYCQNIYGEWPDLPLPAPEK